MSYIAPHITDHGALVDLTAGNGNSGNDDCSLRGPHLYKQTGTADLIQGQASLETCVPGSV